MVIFGLLTGNRRVSYFIATAVVLNTSIEREWLILPFVLWRALLNVDKVKNGEQMVLLIVSVANAVVCRRSVGLVGP